ncbi:MAG: glycerol-3-phosphate dehydrogenase [Candidatus Marinimicrobia bacterium]|nr:glycerol-3-phosphate dehydrogenase [Candidatus Neomarinimicrobiota bacterium]|tara:strand:+ start:325 stop:1338 length:1014 start_codon:yes stop_codon:yes gene_type:complete
MNKKRKVSVLGGGSWGSTISQHLSSLGHEVYLYHRNGDQLNEMREKLRHPLLEQLRFSETIKFIEDLNYLPKSEFMVIAVPSHGVRELMLRVPKNLLGTKIINLSKGIEQNTFKRISEIILETSDIISGNIVTLSGPSHAEEVALGHPTSLVAASDNLETSKEVQKLFSSNSLRIYTNNDIIGVELGGSIKNVIALASGICDGIGFGDNTKASLITRGIVEISRLGVSLGGKAETFAGLSGIGDLIATCLSHHSRNRYVGEQIGVGRPLEEILNEMSMIAEGVKTTSATKELSVLKNIEMPIVSSVYSVLYENINPKEAVNSLMNRELIKEGYMIYY